MSKEKDFLFGVNPVLEKLRSEPADIGEIVLVNKPHRQVLRAIEAEAHRLGVKLRYLPARALDQLAQGQSHQGVVARVGGYAYLPFVELLREIGSAPGSERLLVLDGLTDPRNVGALLRSAEATGVRYVILPRDRSAGVSPAVIKSSAGAVYHLKISRVTNVRRTITELKEHGFWTVALDSTAPEPVYNKSFPPKLAIVLGSEGSGIRPLVLKECDYRVSIPMRGKIASLNVSVAGAVFLYELLRRAEAVDIGKS
jgi:23S rRNA (guanosine2251-2'-O)-methyltransferase